MKPICRAGLSLLLLSLLSLSAFAQDLTERVTEYTLENGLRVVFVEQDAAPVIAFNLMFDVGGADEPDGLGGIAHMVEHMAFKGTESFGSLDLAAEQDALAKLEVAKLALDWLRENGTEEEIVEAEARFAEAQAEAQGLARPSPLDDFLSANGAVGLNATTSYDRTSYVVELPANRLELYARLYADIMANPVFRYFYEERDVVREERRQRSEDDPQGFLFENFIETAFDRHPYGRPLIGAPEEIAAYTASKAEAFYERYYHPNRAVLAIVGDVEPERDIEIIRRYFGALSAGPEFTTPITSEPEQQAEKRFTVSYDAEPQIVIGYHKPTYPEREAYVLDLIDAILSSGRTSRLYKRMILDEQLALSASTASAYPATRYDNLFLFYGLPRAPHAPEDLEAAFYEEIERLKTEPVSEEELQKVKNQVRASAIRSLASNSGLASSLAFNELFRGGWEQRFEDLEIYESITADEIMEVARATFRPENRSVGILLTEEAVE